MNVNNLAWMKGAAAFTPGDTIDRAKEKAAEQGYKPYSEGYAAFITAFAREVRTHQGTSPKKPTAPATADAGRYQAGRLAAA